MQLRGHALSRSDILVGSGGLAFVLAILLPWFSLGDLTRTGFDFWLTGLLPLLLVIGVVASTWLDELTEVDLRGVLRSWPVQLITIQQVMAWTATALVVVRLAFGASYQSVDAVGGSLAIDLDQQPGIYLAVFAAATVGVGLIFKAWDLGGAELGVPATDDPPAGPPPSPEGPSR